MWRIYCDAVHTVNVVPHLCIYCVLYTGIYSDQLGLLWYQTAYKHLYIHSTIHT